MQSPTEICNFALLHLGHTVSISDLTENSNEARACARVFESTLKATLRDFPWSFAKKVAALALIQTDPSTEWGYAYRYPSDCLKILRLQNGMRSDTARTRVSYQVGQDASGKLIYTGSAGAYLEYTAFTQNYQFYPDDFAIALSYRIAGYVAPSLTAGDPFKLRDAAIKMYELELSRARSNAANEEAADRLPEAEAIRARGGWGDDL
jgi:hypothetical protein